MQSWLVGNSSPVAASSAGVQGVAGIPGTSLGPPLHRKVLGLQMGQGWRWQFGPGHGESSMHVPPGQSPATLHFRPTFSGSVVPTQRFSRTSEVRKTVDVSGRSTKELPSAQLAVPEASWAIVLMTQLLVPGAAAFGTGSGGP